MHILVALITVLLLAPGSGLWFVSLIAGLVFAAHTRAWS